MLNGQLHRFDFESNCLGDNPLGDPTRRETWVYTPPGYETGERYPVVILLPGFAANHRSMMGYSPWKPNTVELFDRMVMSKTSSPALLVMPDCVNRWKRIHR